MPDLSKKFTDLKLKQLYGHVLSHYQNCVSRGLDVNATYNEMFLAVQYSLESSWSQSPLAKLEPAEKLKVYAAFNALFNALPLYQGMQSSQRSTFNPSTPQFNPKAKYVINQYNYYGYQDPTLLDWLILSSIINSHNHSYHHHAGSDACCWPSNQHGHDSSSSDDFAKLMAALLLILMALIAVVLAFIALYYMLNEFANSIERFCYGEGWLKGALMFATSIGFGAGSAFLTLNFGAAPLIALAVAAGLNPVGIVIAGAVLLTIIGAGIGCFAMSMLYDSLNKSANNESMDPSDPERFRLTASEEAFLRDEKGMDPIIVRCAMVALRAEMAKLLGNEKPIPSFFSRYFNKENEKVQELLEKLRHLRKGDINMVQVGELNFDCRLPQRVYIPPYYNPVQPLYPEVSPTYSDTPPPYPGTYTTPTAPQYSAFG
ncbi:hypothetical protein [Legionella resiliens]|uniref:Substrate of the Dot/Icm secretion system n=1 Tax=Legionella resiliens TaxID=2905958 RepID=A0ABS8X6Z7_9GAMM|nr:MULTISPECIES: hypothetical protein [unclassified Legionella]MCE0724082.1 hypothetical protein [Legionella sp. 9fVS26]MCE3533235.1 hypothetical protein [Legionella sp. 8cVS16]